MDRTQYDIGTNQNPPRIGKNSNSRVQRLLNSVHAQNQEPSTPPPPPRTQPIKQINGHNVKFRHQIIG